MAGPDPRRRRYRRWLLVAVLIVAPLLVAEVATRGLIAAGRLPIAAAHLEDFEVTWMNLAREGRPDVLILGDSLSQQGLDPAELRAKLSTELGRDVSVFDGASSAGGFGVNRAVVDQLAREGRLPKVAVLGVSPSSFASDATLHQAFAPSPLGGIFTDCALAGGLDDLLACRAGDVSALWRWRGNIDRVLGAILHPWPRTLREQGFLLRADGFRAGPPATVAALRAQLPTALANEGSTLRVGADVPDSFATLVGALREHGVPVVAVAVPYSPVLTDALEARAPGWEGARQAIVAGLGAAAGVSIVDPGRFGSWWGDGSSRDVKHLSRDGAPRFVDQLWSMPAFRDALVEGLGR